MAVRVLVVDDMAVIRAGVCALIDSQEDIEVCGCAADGQEAVAQARALHPQVILMDLEMPRLDGLAATRQIREQGLASRVVIWSIHDSLLRRTQCQEAGAAALIPKGASVDELVQALLQAD